MCKLRLNISRKWNVSDKTKKTRSIRVYLLWELNRITCPGKRHELVTRPTFYTRRYDDVTIPVARRFILDSRPLTNQLVASLSLNWTSPSVLSFTHHRLRAAVPITLRHEAPIHLSFPPLFPSRGRRAVAWRGPSFHSSPVRRWPRWPRPGPGMNITSVVPLRNTAPSPPPLLLSSSVPASAVRHVLVPPWPATLLPPLFSFSFLLSSSFSPPFSATTRSWPRKRSHKMRIWDILRAYEAESFGRGPCFPFDALSGKKRISDVTARMSLSRRRGGGGGGGGSKVFPVFVNSIWKTVTRRVESETMIRINLI